MEVSLLSNTTKTEKCGSAIAQIYQKTFFVVIGVPRVIFLMNRVRLVICLLPLTLSLGCLDMVFLPKGEKIEMVVTGYCPCKKCCGWKRNWFGRPVYAYGHSKGKPKRVGVCADGTKAKKGTIAADIAYYSFGSKMYIPGYGYGIVHDKGGDIKGPYHIDIFFRHHNQALEWGVKKKTVTVVKSNTKLN